MVGFIVGVPGDVLLQMNDPAQERLEILGEFRRHSMLHQQRPKPLPGHEPDRRDPEAVSQGGSHLGGGEAPASELDRLFGRLLRIDGDPRWTGEGERPVGARATLPPGVNPGHASRRKGTVLNDS